MRGCSMYSNHRFEFDNTLDCELRDKATGEVIASFKAREYQTEQQNAGFVGSGINSGGQSYAVATSYDFGDIEFSSYMQLVYVNGTKYMLNYVAKTRHNVMKKRFKGQKVETILYLV